MSDWSYDNIFSQPKPGLHKQEHITYKHDERGALIKEKITRNYYGEQDYQDSIVTEIICSCK